MKYITGYAFIDNISKVDSRYCVLLNKSIFSNIYILFIILMHLKIPKIKFINISIFNNDKIEELSLLEYLLNCNINDTFYDVDCELKINVPTLQIKNYIGD